MWEEGRGSLINWRGREVEKGGREDEGRKILVKVVPNSPASAQGPRKCPTDPPSFR